MRISPPGNPDTGLIDRELEALTARHAPEDTVVALAAVLSLGALQRSARRRSVAVRSVTGSSGARCTRIVTLDHAGERLPCGLRRTGFDMFAVHIGHRVVPVRIVSRFDGGCQAEVDGRQVRSQIGSRADNG